MDIKIEIKVEPGLEGASEKSLSNQIPDVNNFVKQHENDVAIRKNNCETTKKPFVPDACFQNELTLKKEYDKNTFASVNHFPKDLKTKIKEDPFIENRFCKHVVEVQTNTPECPEHLKIDTTLRTEEDPLWLEETSVEIKTFKIPPSPQNDIEGTTLSTNRIHTELSKLRCYSGSEVVDGRDMSSAILEKEHNFKMMKHNSDLATTTEVEGSDATDTSYESNDIHLTSVKQEISQHDDQKESSCKTTKLQKKRHKCQICEKTFAWRADLRTHKFVHEDRMPYQCNICDKGFIRKSSLREHNMKHEGKKPYSCSICEKKFVRMENLNKHSEIHKIKKPAIVSCKLCKESFAHMSHFRAHKKVHTGKALQVCQICGKSYTFMSELKRHLISHEDTKQHQCPICQKRFTYGYHLNRHIIVLHQYKHP